MAFWGKQVGTEKPQPYVPPPESARLHLSQATLDPNAPEGKKAALKCKVGEEEFFVCSLREGAQESVTLDLYFNSYTEFSVHGAPGAKVHLTGYIVEEDDEDEEYEDREDEALEVPPELEGCLEGLDMMSEEQTDELLRFLKKQQKLNLEESSSDEEEEEEEDEDMEESPPPVRRKKSSVIIEDITDLKPDAPTGEAIPILVSAEGDDKKAAKPDAGKADDKKAGKDGLIGQPSEAKTVKEQIHSKTPAKAKASGKAAAKKEEEDEEIDLGDEDTEDGESDDDEDMESDEEGEEEGEDEDEGEEAAAPALASNKRKAAAALEAKPAAKKTKAEAGKPEQQAAAQKKKLEVAANGGSPATATKGKKPQIKTYPNGFVIETMAQGSGAGKLAKPGKKVVVKYVGKLVKTGKVFDQTKGNKTFSFRLGVGEVIKGWDQGVAGMRVGDKRRLTVPPQMGYGSTGVKGVIPGNAALQFDVELCDVKG